MGSTAPVTTLTARGQDRPARCRALRAGAVAASLGAAALSMPAASAAPTPPAGCVFDRGTGTSVCTTTTVIADQAATARGSP